jgi:hypothetical protein
VVGPAGAGKTTVLGAARERLASQTPYGRKCQGLVDNFFPLALLLLFS